MNDIFIYGTRSGLLHYHKYFESILRKYKNMTATTLVYIFATIYVYATYPLGLLSSIQLSESFFSFTRYDDYTILVIHRASLGEHFGSSVTRELTKVLQRSLNQSRRSSKSFSSEDPPQTAKSQGFDSQIFNRVLTQMYKQVFVSAVQDMVSAKSDPIEVIFTYKLNLDTITNSMELRYNELIIRRFSDELDGSFMSTGYLGGYRAERGRGFWVFGVGDLWRVIEVVNVVLAVLGQE